MRKRIVQWIAGVLLVVLVAGFLAFLYYIPPFLTAPPEAFSGPVAAAAPLVTTVADPAQRALAERGRYLVMTAGCIGCHAANGARGPDYSRYLAGGGLKFETAQGTVVSRNLTPDPETGLARRTDDEVKRVLRSGVLPDGRIVAHTVMPWANFSNWTEEDRQAVVVYLKSLPAVRQRIPDSDVTMPLAGEAGVVERAFGGKDYSAR